ncbi:telomerase protein component 1-like [Heptranchias perlo]|uniref:telomerase protein component 1-like n=1 Tax=Heptranchias perlo TaxID=212740 RepID=UPI00355A10B8
MWNSLPRGELMGCPPPPADRSMVCADSRGTLWCTAGDPSNIPTQEEIVDSDHVFPKWIRKQVHTDRVTAVTEANDLIVTASYDQSVRLWDRRSLKQVGLFTCQAPVLCWKRIRLPRGGGLWGLLG